MFGELGQETKKSEDCAANCVNKYVLKARIRINQYHSDYSLEGKEVIVT